jgi:exonuclease SbcC
MRPTRLELEGFASFREPATVDFSDAELFVLTGPTGSGKSSLIDAITFALYGLVHRHGGKDVAPVITQGRLEARVRLDFEVEGQAYTAVRVVQRTKSGGATTREARLERDGEVLAGSPGELTDWVNRLIGLPFEHFTRCVVLPQGEFARFLLDKPGERQDLLVKLLDLEVYGRMASAASQRQRGADERIKLVDDRLARGLAYATTETRDAAKRSIGVLERVAGKIDEVRPQLEELRRRRETMAEEERAAAALAKQLAALAPPAKDLELARRAASAQQATKEATAAVEKAKAALQAKAAARKKLPDPSPLRETLVVLRRRAEQQKEIEKTTKEAAAARKAADDARKALAKADEALVREERGLAAARRADVGAALAAELVVGDTCPVCGSKVRTLPHADTPKKLEKAQAGHVAAKRARDEADAKHRRGQDAAERLDGELASRQKELEKSAKAVAKAPTAAEIETTLASIAAADRALDAARQGREDADAALQDRASELERAREAERAAWQRLDRERDGLAALQPPPLDRRDLAAGWSALERWAREQAPAQRERAGEAQTAARKIDASIVELRDQIASAFAAAGIDPGAGDPRAVCADALASARATLRSIEAGLEEAKELRAEIAVLRETSQLAKSLALHLGARGFESWVLHRVMRALAAGASQRLLELSREQYSFELDEKSREILVVDHTNAGEVRSARTLSGGETFLASLALALALSEQVSHLAARGAARLDALFLDEGFGALDPETLEVVAGAIEDLGARGHMVGIVTHVRELAERIPVRYEVTKDTRTSRVEKVAV